MEVIKSDTLLNEIDHHFRVFAGPGAGKTYWLINHILNVLKNSQRLSPSMYIACISFTNVAVNEIRKRLGQSVEKVEVATIHSFLYKNVVKPYLHLLKDKDGNCLVAHTLVDGHDEHRPTYSNIDNWLNNIGSGRLIYKFQQDQSNWGKYLKKVRWQINLETEEYKPKLIYEKPPKYLPSSKLDIYYKKIYWEKGVENRYH